MRHVADGPQFFRNSAPLARSNSTRGAGRLCGDATNVGTAVEAAGRSARFPHFRSERALAQGARAHGAALLAGPASWLEALKPRAPVTTSPAAEDSSGTPPDPHRC